MANNRQAWPTTGEQATRRNRFSPPRQVPQLGSKAQLQARRLKIKKLRTSRNLSLPPRSVPMAGASRRREKNRPKPVVTYTKSAQGEAGGGGVSYT